MLSGMKIGDNSFMLWHVSLYMLQMRVLPFWIPNQVWDDVICERLTWKRVFF